MEVRASGGMPTSDSVPARRVAALARHHPPTPLPGPGHNLSGTKTIYVGEQLEGTPKSWTAESQGGSASGGWESWPPRRLNPQRPHADTKPGPWIPGRHTGTCLPPRGGGGASASGRVRHRGAEPVHTHGRKSQPLECRAHLPLAGLAGAEGRMWVPAALGGR